MTAIDVTKNTREFANKQQFNLGDNLNVHFQNFRLPEQSVLNPPAVESEGAACSSRSAASFVSKLMNVDSSLHGGVDLRATDVIRFFKNNIFRSFCSDLNPD